MADTLSSPVSRQALTESEACSNGFAYRLWLRARGLTNPSCEANERDSALSLIQDFAGRPDIAPALLAGLLLAADLRPDDRIWVAGVPPAWLPPALSLTAGLAESLAKASVLVTGAMPDSLLPGIRRVILTGDDAGQGNETPFRVTVSLVRCWV
ncbi:hypothetical protein [Acidisoma silvae]|uniref:Uncharacterized protein n=1 Tax=Acidisoma silvae TaxID=2802396 RepID=A0A963YT61_9PROT|nr:hypothetical protein [Acidisoma silvae]MCB8876592.1 hypothetical protein [Acidisoma silvae]